MSILRAHSITAIPTRYNGYNFRSRIEARWSIFFNAIGIDYEYEPRTYEMPDGIWYLPDFWIPSLRCFIEIKGAKPTRDEIRKAKGLASVTLRPVYIFFGRFGIPDHRYVRNVSDSAYLYRPYVKRGKVNIVSDYAYWWCECPFCHTLSIEFEGITTDICECFKRRRLISNDSYCTPRLVDAYLKAAREKF